MDIQKILLDFEKDKETKEFKIALDSTVNEINKLFEERIKKLNGKITLLENNLKAYRNVNSQIEFMLKEKLHENNR